ncbi:hypothetical protein EGW08_000514 [Elysia chlorotica]|uniref:SUZ RNA-binding domain-containing n=1 Tax=Elysia chlorotica TaxID=188477 RepID=A0A433UD30_ELYCH|nr:hypothetical protein EGW08_000514 [Elysia chlorotica]
MRSEKSKSKMADDEAEVLDNWEEQADSGVLDKRLEEMAIDVSNNRERQKVISVAKRMVVTEDTGSTPYQPQVRILKRDTSAPSPHQNTSGASPSGPGSSKHSKSLQQREAEYAQARLRILGSLPPPDDGEESENSSASNNTAPAGKKGNSGYPSSPRVAILRQPRSPDGTSGFKKPDHT